MLTDWIHALALGASFSFGLGPAAPAQDSPKDRGEDPRTPARSRSAGTTTRRTFGAAAPSSGTTPRP
ncbi:MAG TPA: hypothetical protein VKW04_03335 [Planctomycetota bacterium]|nr:hypothetical protein [Planctomycetota bacterium]